MTELVAYIERGDRLTVSIDGVPYTRGKTDPYYQAILRAAKQSDAKVLRELLTAKDRAAKMWEAIAEAGIVSRDGHYYYGENLLPNLLQSYLTSAIARGGADPVVKFVQRVYQNPIHGTRQMLFDFMMANQLPLTEDGCFIAYKYVRYDYKDAYTGTVDNSPGADIGPLLWSEVDTNPEKTCSFGYHVCSLEYLPKTVDPSHTRIVAVKVPPEWVGAIPPDYNNSKVRTRGYTVVRDITQELIDSGEKHRLADKDWMTAEDTWYNPDYRDF